MKSQTLILESAIFLAVGLSCSPLFGKPDDHGSYLALNQQARRTSSEESKNELLISASNIVALAKGGELPPEVQSAISEVLGEVHNAPRNEAFEMILKNPKLEAKLLRILRRYRLRPPSEMAFSESSEIRSFGKLLGLTQ